MSEDIAWWYRGSQPVPVADLVGAGSFVLLAPGGAGKTTVLEALRSCESDATVIDLSLHDKSGMHRELDAAIDVGKPVYLDGLDVAAREEPAALRILRSHVVRPQARPIQWRLACRPAAWDAHLSQALSAAQIEFREFALLPLTRAAAEALCERVDAPKEFIDIVIKAKLGRLAGSALRFQAAAQQWRDNGTLPDSPLAAIAYEVERLLADAAPTANPTLSLDRMLRIAMRMAAMVVFGSINRYALSSEPVAPGRSEVSALPSTPEPDEPGVTIGPEAYAEVLNTALFDAAVGSSLAFRHQQYAEYLAARYVTQRSSVTRGQIRDLLRAGPGGQVPGVLGGVLAWLLALRPDLADDLVPANAHLLAQAGVELPSGEVRGLIISALLETARTGDSEPEWGYDLSSLGHATLESVLIQHLDDGLTDAGHLWWVARLAETTGCKGVAEKLLVEALRETWPAWARRPAIAAVATSEDSANVSRLSPLLKLDAAHDPDDELLAAAIEATYPRLLDVADLLEVLRPRTNRSLVGAYLMLLSRLPDQFSAGDLPEVLEWASQLTGSADEDNYGQFPERLVEVAWRNRQAEQVLPALASFVANLISPLSQSPWNSRRQPPWVTAPSEERRQLLVLTAQKLDSTSAYDLITSHLATKDDADYLLASLPNLPAASWPALSEILSYFIREPSCNQADAVLAMREDHPAFLTTAIFRGTVDVYSSIAQQRRRFRERELRMESEGVERARRRREHLTGALEAAKADVNQWWCLPVALSRGNHYHDDLFTHDFTCRPGWQLLDDAEREAVFDLGMRYLQQHKPSVAPEHLQQINDLEVMPDWSGVFFLTTLTAHRQEALRQLEVAVWQHWAVPIVTAWNNDHEDGGRKLRQALLGFAPATARAHLAEAALAALPADSEWLPQSDTYRNLMPELAPHLMANLLRGDYRGNLGATLVDLLVEEVPAVASDFCLELWRTAQPTLADKALRGLVVLKPELVIKLHHDGELAASELSKVASHFNINALSNSEVSLIAEILLDQYPPHLDAPWDSKSHRRRGPERARDGVLGELVERGLVDVIESLNQGRHDTDRWILSRCIRRARDRATDLTFIPIEPAELLQLLGRADARIVRNDEDLQTVVVETLRDLQHVISREAYRDLWNLGTVPNPKSEDDISDWLRRNLEQRLGGGAVVGRELQVRRPTDRGIGTRIDLTAAVSTDTHPRHQATVIAEAKLVNHRELLTALHGQLVERYLEQTGLRCGIYLVYWVDPAQRPPPWRQDRLDLANLMQELTEQARSHEPELKIVPFALDISRAVS
ncbi:hypothetical protein [Amycolatopsis echigonensis]|uniref:hypothetical protein n=1 Tax=Amycolatopsis echigonensis TaxID=2576905 RepID=UPI0011773901|nr:hypothetical protein [Amycolatopsis niigatensis]